jgi:hypothetical protein
MMSRFLAFVMLVTLAAAQQMPTPKAAKSSGSITEPILPVVVENACPFEGCTFRQWTVEKDSVLYTTWHDDRKQISQAKQGERVQGLTGVYITLQPDRFLVTQPIPAFSLKTGDVILQYGEWGEGASDLWANGERHKYFNWGEDENGQLILGEANITLIRHGVKEWWVQVKALDGKTGWAISNGNFGHMDQLGDNPREEPNAPDDSAHIAEIPEPQLPIFDESSCPGKGRIVAHWKISRAVPFYSSWLNARMHGGQIEPGDEVAVVAGMEVIQSPDRILLTQPVEDLSLQKDDVVLRYFQYGEGFADIWAKGQWHLQYYLATTNPDGTGCRHQCNSVPLKKGVREWWVEVRNSSGQTGWVLALRRNGDDTWDDGNFDNLCPN